MCGMSRFAMFRGNRATRVCTQANARNRPPIAPAKASSRLSVRNWRNKRYRAAPIAERTAISPRRPHSTHQQKVGHVHARDQQHKTNRTHQQQQRRANIPADCLPQADQVRCVHLLVCSRMFLRQLLSNCVHVRSGLLLRHPWTQPRDNPQKTIAAIPGRFWSNHKWRP